MRMILLICDSEFEKEFIKKYFHGINYIYQDGKYIGQYDVVTVVKPYQTLVGFRVNRAIIDKNLVLDEMYIDHVKGAIVQDGKVVIEYV